MFPLDDFLRRHGVLTSWDKLSTEWRSLFSEVPVRSSSGEIFQSKGGADFEFTLRGFNTPERKTAAAVIVPDAHTCIVIERTDKVLSATTVLREDIVWAAVRQFKIERPDIKAVEDE